MKTIQLSVKNSLWLEVYGETSVLCGMNGHSYLGLVDMKRLSVTSLPCSCGECIRRETMEAVVIAAVAAGARNLVVDSIREDLSEDKLLIPNFVDSEKEVFVVKMGYPKDSTIYFSSKSEISKYLLSQKEFRNHKTDHGNRELISELLKCW